MFWIMGRHLEAALTLKIGERQSSNMRERTHHVRVIAEAARVLWVYGQRFAKASFCSFVVPSLKRKEIRQVQVKKCGGRRRLVLMGY